MQKRTENCVFLFWTQKRTDPSRVRIHELESVFHHFISRCFRSSYAAGMSASSVPLVAESVDLVGELGEVLVGAALVVLDDPQQALAGIEQALEDGSRTGCTLADVVLDADTGAFLQADRALGTDGPLLTIIRCAGVEALLREGLGKDVLHLILAVDDEHSLGLRLKGVDPLQQALPVGAL